jgi:VanZ family protein
MSRKIIVKVCGLGVLLLFVFAALGPTKLVPRSGLGWRIDHFFSYFVLTLMFCLAWRRPFLAGGALMAIAVLLEGLQVFIPGRHADVYAALIGAGGAMAAILPSDFLIRAPSRMTANSIHFV